MAIQILHENELGLGLEKDSTNKLAVKVKPGSALTLSNLGLDVTIPPAPEVPTAIKTITVQGNQLKLVDTKGTESYLPLPAQVVDVRLQNAKVNEQNELELELSNGQKVKASLAKFVDAPKSAQEYWDEIKALPTFKATLIGLIKGEEVQDFAGNSKGYLLTSN